VVREPFCGLSHGLGAVLSLIGLPVLLYLAAGRPRHVVGIALYGLGLITLYTASALYHSLHVAPRAAGLLQRLDHAAIFLLIAGTYAPVCLVTLRGTLGWSLLAAEYTLALVGVIVVLCRLRLPDALRVVLYLFMGWLALAALGPLSAALPRAGLVWLLAGGVLYSVGTVIFATDRPHLWPGRFSAHDLWHVFVLGGSLCHFVLMARFVAPAT
jgi:hemolysin III